MIMPEKIIDDAERLYGNLHDPGLRPDVHEIYNGFPRTEIVQLLSEFYLNVRDVTELNEDRCLLIEVELDRRCGVIAFSFVMPYYHPSNIVAGDVLERLNEANYLNVDREILDLTVDASVDFFSFDDDVSIENILFSNYRQNWESYERQTQ